MNLIKNAYLWGIIFLSSSLGIYAQEVEITLGKSEIGLNEYFTITISVSNDRLKGFSEFPSIEGFTKRGTSSSSQTNYVNGRMSSTQSLIQNYQANAKGVFRLSPFSMKINNKEVFSDGIQITVSEPIQRRSSRRSTLFDDFFGRNEPLEFVEVEADAFTALSIDKKEVYVGEGFTATYAFYVSASNQAEMRFYDLSNQITEIVKKIKPSGCWEENFIIDQIEGEPIKLNGKNYTRYKIYQTTYYPLTVQDIEFPTVGLKMIKYKVAQNPSFLGRNRQEDYKTFYSKAKQVKVKELPNHPLRDQVNVGTYRLKETLDKKEIKTGESFTYHFDIVGEGNISSIKAPVPKQNDFFDFYSPNIKQSINRANGKVSGEKGYSFYGIPTEAGSYDLGDYFSWIFFNTEKKEYDTLRSELMLRVEGESRKNISIASNDLGDFYNRIDATDNTLREISGEKWIHRLLLIFISLLTLSSFYLFFRKTHS